MAKAFGGKNKISSWILYFEVSRYECDMNRLKLSFKFGKHQTLIPLNLTLITSLGRFFQFDSDSRRTENGEMF